MTLLQVQGTSRTYSVNISPKILSMARVIDVSPPSENHARLGRALQRSFSLKIKLIREIGLRQSRLDHQQGHQGLEAKRNGHEPHQLRHLALLLVLSLPAILLDVSNSLAMPLRRNDASKSFNVNWQVTMVTRAPLGSTSSLKLARTS